MANDRLKKKSPEQKQAEAAEGMAAYRAREAAVNANMQRLRELRRAHEAANPPQPVVAVKAGRAKKK